MLNGMDMGERKRVLLLGKSGRLDAMAAALSQSPRLEGLYILSEVSNPGLVAHSTNVKRGDSASPPEVLAYAALVQPDLAVIGPEEPLEAGIVDELAKIGIPSVGPTRDLARIETSKAFARDLMRRHGIPGNPEHRIFADCNGLRSYLHRLGEFVVKPDGLTGGKGVRVSGEHLHSVEEAVSYCEEIFASAGHVVIEERLEGEEFTLQSFCDGETVVPMIPVQDHKRLANGDTGPNTGGMGSYSCEDHSLPFLTHSDLDAASSINRAVANALRLETNNPYKGILYGGFMLTREGLRVIEFNARFGDPEALNILPLLETDFLDVCTAIIEGTLHQLDIRFRRQATVCKYVVPDGYPAAPVKNVAIRIPHRESHNLKIYQGAIQTVGDELQMSGSRAVGFVGIGSDLEEAEQLAEAAASSVEGPVYHRSDIGTAELVQARVDHMARIFSPTTLPETTYLATAM